MKNGAQSEFEDHCRRRGDPGAIVLPAGTWMRRNPGLLVQPPSTRRRDPGNFGKRISIDREINIFVAIENDFFWEKLSTMESAKTHC